MIDLMAKGESHCLYHLGAIKKHSGAQVFLHSSSAIVEANSWYAGANLDISNVTLLEKSRMLKVLIGAILAQKKVVLLGAHLWQLIMLIPLLLINRKVEVHLHGQAFALKRKGVKYFLWRILAFLTDLRVSNPAWRGPDFVKIVDNYNYINHGSFPKDGEEGVLYYSAIFKSPSTLSNIREKIERLGKTFIYPNSSELISYKYLNELLRQVGYLYFESTDDYYHYSPSGRISDALNYSLQVVVLKEDNTSKEVLAAYKVEYIEI